MSPMTGLEPMTPSTPHMGAARLAAGGDVRAEWEGARPGTRRLHAPRRRALHLAFAAAASRREVPEGQEPMSIGRSLRHAFRTTVFALTPALGLVLLPLRLLDLVWPSNPVSIAVATAIDRRYPRWYHLHTEDAARTRSGEEYLVERRERARTNLERYGVELAATRFLEVGCGTGAKTEFYGHVLAPRIAVGVDVDPDPLRVGVASGVLAGEHAPSLILAPPYVLPFRDAAFDLVLCEEVLEHVAEPERLLGEIARVLAPGGRALLLIGPMYLHAKGPHLQNHLSVLWPHVLFSKRTIERLVRSKPEGEGLETHEYLMTVFLTLNRLRESRYRSSIRGCGLAVERLERSAEHPALAAIPWFGEYYRKSLRVVLRKG